MGNPIRRTRPDPGLAKEGVGFYKIYPYDFYGSGEGDVEYHVVYGEKVYERMNYQAYMDELKRRRVQ
jgi:hypothetical protein